MDKTIWIVGKFRQKIEPPKAIWDIVGIFEAEELAIDICKDRPDCFISYIELNKVLPNENIIWDNSYYPKKED